MSVFRELVTKLSFKVDRKGLDNLEKSLSSFKSKFSLITAGATYFGKKVLDTFAEFSKAITDTDDLAKSANVATGQFIALRRAAEQAFQLQPEKFDAYFTRVSKFLRDGKAGVGEVYEILRKSRGLLNLTPFINAHDVEGAFKAIIDYVDREIPNLQEKIQALTYIFGDENPAGLLRIVNAGSEAFFRQAEAQREYGDAVAANIPEVRKYQQELTKFYQALDELKVKAALAVLPLLTNTVKLITPKPLGAGVDYETLKGQELMGQFSPLNSIADSFKTFIEYLSKERTPLEEDQDISRRVEDYQKSYITQTPVSMNNAIEINVPPGTNTEQAQFMALAVQQSIRDFYGEVVREVISNNPQVE